MPTDQPRTYKHQLTADEFVFAFTATEADFAARADEMRQKGVERLTGRELRKRFTNSSITNDQDNSRFTFVSECNLISHEVVLKGTIWPLSLLLANCRFPNIEIIDCTSVTTDFHLIGSITGALSITNSVVNSFFIRHSEMDSVSIEANSKAGSFHIEQYSNIGEFSIVEGTMYNFLADQSRVKSLRIENCVVGLITVRGSSKVEHITLGELSVTNDISIENSSVASFYNSLIGRCITGRINIDNSELSYFSAFGLYSSFFIYRSTIIRFHLSECHIPKLEISSGCKIEAHIYNSSINFLDFQHLILGKDSIVSLSGCQVFACMMEEFAVLGQLYLRQLQPLLAPFQWYDAVERAGENPSPRKLALIEQHIAKYKDHCQMLKDRLRLITPTFRIVQSSLGKTEFTNCDLGKFRFEFNNAKITEVFMSGGTAPEELIGSSDDRNVFIYGETRGTLAWHEQKVSLYNQLKKIFENQGDIYRSAHYNALTAKHQQRTLHIRLGRQPAKKNWTRRAGRRMYGYVRSKLPTDVSFDAFTFGLNQYSNLHGESWGRALAFTLLIPVPIYLLFLASVGLIDFAAEIDWNLAGAYFAFIDPTHRVDFLKNIDGHQDLKLTGWTSPVDFVGRVFVGYGIYQFITAFRRHGRR